ncbi:thiol-disulfide oxidoreductase DCC family protein [Thiomicrospira sp. WB1]|uniref:thiol-disulfide oxidoreductase DCC family protein n=1 Tax=Thiomicrospira sp. WB1 TaxID=1685380 RepID=UPI00074820C0|nr:DUF393 domain-containing protein [Thiomicrospira sp. WB1]KUJ71497.1 thiol-disulfide oxidoreductase [Thiomicrospira sp. WB1]
MIKVFYDGKCGMCSKEIRHYQAVAPGGVFDWVDITTLSLRRLDDEGLDRVEGLKHLHAKDEAGQMLTGVDAFLLIWQELARWRLFAKIIRLPGIYALTKRIYRLFARWRFHRLSHCQMAVKANNCHHT